MKIHKTAIPDVLVLEPRVFRDDRGYFFESYNEKVFRDLGLPTAYAQDNQSRSARNVIRGLHYQVAHPQGKLVRVVCGAVFDVAVDLRRNSPTLGRWVGEVLSAENQWMVWIPVGFAHAFAVLSDSADVLYKATDRYDPTGERTIVWNDPELDQARDYIALSNSEEIAARITMQIVNGVQQLATFPMSGRPGRVPGTRELVILSTPFIAVYAIEKTRIVILAVYHGAQQWPGVF
jgi:dTDP-4-dehydrorhamnose 3,5-epimerase